MSVGLYRKRTERMLRFALLLSLCAHLGGAALYGFISARLPRVPGRVPRPQATETFVTLTQALTFDRRRHPRLVARAHPPPIARPRVVVRPAATHVRPPLIAHTLATQAQAPIVRVPKLQKRPPPARGGLTQEHLAHLTQDFTQAIAASRGAHDPLRAPTRVASSMKTYHLQFEGRISTLRVGQGILTPIKSWSADGYTYYYVTYELVWPDGTYESGAVPWPIRYRPAEDPFASGIPDRHIPLPAPLPGWGLPPAIHLGKALRDYFPEYKEPSG